MRATARVGMTLRWAWQALLLHKTRSALTVLAVGLATALLASTVGFQVGYERSLERGIEALGYQVLITGKGCPHEAATLILRGGSIPMYIPEELASHIIARPEVDDATRFFMQSVPQPDGRSQQLYVGVDSAFLGLKPGVSFQRGQWFSSETAAEVVLGYNVAEYRRLELSDEVEVQGRRFVVRGVLDKLGTQDDGTIFLPLGVAQELFEKSERLTGIGVRLTDLALAGSFVDAVSELPAVQVVRLSQVQSTILGILSDVRGLLVAFGAMCLVVALMGVFNVALIAVVERLPELAVLRALGCPAGVLFVLVWSESLLLAVCGAGAGALLTLALREAVGWSLRSLLSFVPVGTTVAVSPPVLLTSCAAVSVLGLLAGVFPAWRSARVAPMASMRALP